MRRGGLVPAILALGGAISVPAVAQTAQSGVPASFDCGKATRAVDRFICANAALRWQDYALSRSYSAVRDAATGPARAALLAQQRDWLGERDRRCAADRSFAELDAAGSPVHEQAHACMDTVYRDRRFDLGDRAAPPVMTRVLGEIDLRPIARARPELAEAGRVRVAGMRLSPDGSQVAILLPSQELDLPDQAWLYRVADRKLVPATPRPDRQAPHPADAIAAINAFAWREGTLYVAASTWGDGSDGHDGPGVFHAATVDGSRRLPGEPAKASDHWQSVTGGSVIRDDEIPDDEAALESVRASDAWLVWLADRGQGVLDLHVRTRKPPGSPYLVAWGGWELLQFLFDDVRSRLVYPADTGIVRLDLATRSERRIAGTGRGDTPLAISADLGTLLWSTRNDCGDEFLFEPDADAPEHFCLATMAGND